MFLLDVVSTPTFIDTINDAFANPTKALAVIGISIIVAIVILIIRKK